IPVSAMIVFKFCEDINLKGSRTELNTRNKPIRKPSVPVAHVRGDVSLLYIAVPIARPPKLAINVSGKETIVANNSDKTNAKTIINKVGFQLYLDAYIIKGIGKINKPININTGMKLTKSITIIKFPITKIHLLFF